MTVALLVAAAFAVSLAAGPPRAEAPGRRPALPTTSWSSRPSHPSGAYWLGGGAGASASSRRGNVYWRNVVGSSPPAGPPIRPTPTTTSRPDGAVEMRAPGIWRFLITVFGAGSGRRARIVLRAPPWDVEARSARARKLRQALAERYSGWFEGLPGSTCSSSGTTNLWWI